MKTFTLLVKGWVKPGRRKRKIRFKEILFEKHDFDEALESMQTAPDKWYDSLPEKYHVNITDNDQWNASFGRNKLSMVDHVTYKFLDFTWTFKWTKN